MVRAPHQNPFRSFQIASVLNRLSLHHTRTTLGPGETLSAGSFLQSKAGQKTGTVWTPRYQLIMQSDGDLVLYDRGQVKWSSHTIQRNGSYAVMQTDGNFVVFDANNVPLWATGTKAPGSHLCLEDNGTAVIVSPTQKHMWSSQENRKQQNIRPVKNIFEQAAEDTYQDVGFGSLDDDENVGNPSIPDPFNGLQMSYATPVTREIRQELYDMTYEQASMGADGTIQTNNTLLPGQSISSNSGNYTCRFQTDGNLVVYDRNGGVRWASGTDNKGGSRCVMQGDGNLVIYAGSDDSHPLWATGTNGQGSNIYAAMQDDGNFVLYDQSRNPKWASDSHRGGDFLGMHIDIFNAAKSLVPANAQGAFNQAANALQKGISIPAIINAAKSLTPPQQAGVAAVTALATAHLKPPVHMASFGPNMDALAHAGNMMFSGMMVMPSFPMAKPAVAQMIVAQPAARAGAVVAANAIAAKESFWTKIKHFFGIGLHK